MRPDLTLFSIVMLVGAAHGLFLALTLINTRDAGVAGRPFLAILTLAFAVDLGHEFLFQSRYLLDALALAYIDPIVNLLYGPSFYLYARALTGGVTFRFTRWHWLHALPVAVAIIACLALPNLAAGQFVRLFYENAIGITADEVLVQRTIGSIALASVFSIGIYLFLSMRLLVRHARVIRQQFSSLEKVTLNWLRALLVALSVLYFILIFDGFFGELVGLDENLNRLLYLMVVVVIYSMGYMGIRQPAIFTSPESVAALESVRRTPETATDNTVSEKPRDGAKYRTSALDSSMSAALREELESYMNKERPYLESQLTLPQLAQQLGISPNYLSQVINEQLQKNFFDFINEYRVAEAKSKLIADSTRKSSIADVAYDSGFNSKSAFYTAFKKHVGMTPSEFRASESRANQV
jgi:AraC-like DNA-binding protein